MEVQANTDFELLAKYITVSNPSDFENVLVEILKRSSDDDFLFRLVSDAIKTNEHI